MKEIYDKNKNKIGKFTDSFDENTDHKSLLDKKMSVIWDIVYPIGSEMRIHSDESTVPDEPFSSQDLKDKHNWFPPNQVWEYVSKLSDIYPVLTPWMDEKNRGKKTQGNNRIHNHSTSSHNHMWSKGLIYQNADSKNEEKALIQVKTFNSSGSNYTSPYYGSGSSDGSTTFNAYTDSITEIMSSSGGDHNKPSGIGTGYMVTYVFIRIK